MKKIVIFLCLTSLLCLSACTIQPPTPGGLGESTAQEQNQDTTAKTDTSDQPADSKKPTDTEPDTDTDMDTTEAQTTYGPLHFPETDPE